MKKNLNHTTSHGITLTILIENIPRDDRSDHWAYTLMVTDPASGSSRTFTATIKKSLCATVREADLFILRDPLQYLKEAFLDEYREGHFPKVWPDMSRGWAVF